MSLSARAVADFDRDGFLVLEGFVPAATCDALRARMAELLPRLVEESTPTVFSTTDQRHARAAWFLDSGDKVRCFFEEGAFEPDGRLRTEPALAVNKVGHALHELDPVFTAFSRQPALARAAHDLGLADPRLIQSMYIFKQPHIGGEVTSHQDSTFLYTEPLSCVGFWFALEDATEENGCLLVEPGGHRRPLHQRFVRHGDETRMIELDPEPLPSEGLLPVPAPKGTMVVLHGSLPHRSAANRSPRSRHAYTLHLIDGACAYAPDNWLQRTSPAPGF